MSGVNDSGRLPLFVEELYAARVAGMGHRDQPFIRQIGDLARERIAVDGQSEGIERRREPGYKAIVGVETIQAEH